MILKTDCPKGSRFFQVNFAIIAGNLYGIMAQIRTILQRLDREQEKYDGT
jgi:hypothetical protein